MLVVCVCVESDLCKARVERSFKGDININNFLRRVLRCVRQKHALGSKWTTSKYVIRALRM